MIKLGQIVLKGVNWVDNTKIRSYGIERSQLGTQYNQKHVLGPKLKFWKNNLVLNSKATDSWKTGFWPKTAVLMKTMLFEPKTVVIKAKNHGFHENYSFLAKKLQFSWKLQILTS